VHWARSQAYAKIVSIGLELIISFSCTAEAWLANCTRIDEPFLPQMPDVLHVFKYLVWLIPFVYRLVYE